MLIFLGLPAKDKAGVPKRRAAKPTNPTSTPPHSEAGLRRPPSPRRPPKTPDQSQADKGEWEFRALARNPKRYKVGWMPA